MLARFSLCIGFAVLTGLAFGCSSSEPSTGEPSSQPGDDTGTTADAVVEDTAPWNTYPAGPYGLNGPRLAKDGKTRLPGQIFPPLKWKGYKNGTGEWTDISIQDYYDPTGERGVNAILFVVSAEWCGPCREEAKDLPGFYDSLYKPRGAAFVAGMIDQSKKDATGNFLPADQATVDRWQKLYKLNFDIVADGERTSMDPELLKDPEAAPTGAIGIPRNYIINPRNMQIVRVNSGVNPDASIIPGLNPLLDANGAPKLEDAGT